METSVITLMGLVVLKYVENVIASYAENSPKHVKSDIMSLYPILNLNKNMLILYKK